MIYSNFYPTVSTFTSGMELTDYIQNLTYTDDPASAYYMGYIPFEDYPESILGLSYIAFSENLTRANFKFIADNHPWGYCRQDDTGTDTGFRTQLYALDNGAAYRYNTSTSQAQTRLFNKLTIANLNQCDSIRFNIVAFADLTEHINDGTTFIINSNNFNSTVAIKTLQEMIDFIENDASFTCICYYDGSSHTISFKYSDFGESGYTAKVVDGTYTIFIHFESASFPKPAKISYETGGGGHSDGGASLVPFVRTKLNEPMGFDEQYAMLCVSPGATDCRLNLGLGRTVFSGWSANTKFKKAIFAHFPFSSIDLSELPNNGGIPLGQQYFGVIREDLFVKTAASDGTSIFIRPPQKPIDLLHILQIINRIQSNATGQTQLTIRYGTANAYLAADQVSLFDDDNKPLWKSMQGDAALAQNKLQPWQMPEADLSANAFNPADMPEYDPGGGGDDGADSGGDRIAPYDFTNTPLSAANNFTTLYALTTAQVAEFGAIMWASLSDPNFWHAVGVTFENDFSINPADMMRYFNFLRYYPFDLKNYSTTYSSGIYIGRSTVPIQFPAGFEYPRRVNRNLIQINGGTVTPALPAPYNTDDFRVSDPSTQIQAHIPFCGTVQLSAAECYGKELSLNYVVDLQTGAIQATISVQSDTFYIIATLAGTCGAAVQITANNNIEFLTRIATVATGGISSAANMATQGAKIAGEEGAIVGAVAGALTGTVSAIAGLPPVTVHKQGNTTGFANFGGDPQAYITIQTPKRAKPASYAKSIGYVSNKQAKIADLSGYTEMINPDVSGIAAHQDELDEIRNILETGFFA